MTFSIHIDQPTAEALARAARTSGRTRNALIREAIRTWLATAERAEWPTIVRRFTGEPRAARFEDLRTDLVEPRDPFEVLPRRRRRT
ncbi:MAG TPA: ribbon-helix-helix protein, CopG family [Vicinamibacterales bacterium]|jgi:hypothetical protein